MGVKHIGQPELTIGGSALDTCMHDGNGARKILPPHLPTAVRVTWKLGIGIIWQRAAWSQALPYPSPYPKYPLQSWIPYSSKFSFEFHDLTSDHKNFPHQNLVLWWAWLCTVQCSDYCTLADSKHVLCTFTANGSRRLEASWKSLLWRASWQTQD